jgi:hypothetical protein
MSKENSKESVKLEEGVLDTPPSFQDEAVVPDDDSRYITGRKHHLHVCSTAGQLHHLDISSRYNRSAWRIREEFLAFYSISDYFLR